MTEPQDPLQSPSPTTQDAVAAFFDEFDFGEGSDRTRLSYRSGARTFLRFLQQHEALTPRTRLAALPPSITADFNAWMQTVQGICAANLLPARCFN